MAVAQELEAAINLLLTNYVTTKSAALCAALAPLALTGVTIYVMVMGYAIARGEAHDSLHTFMWKALKISLIAGIALGAGVYQTVAIGAVQGTQGALTQSIGGVATVGQLVDNMAQPYDELGQALWSQAVTGFWPNFALLAAAAIVALAQACLFVIGLGMYLLATVALHLVCAVGPVFIFCAMFPATQRFTESWIGQALQFVFLNVLIAASIAMLTDFASQFAQAMNGNVGSTNVLRDALALLLCSGALAVVMLNLNTVASALAGGAQISGIGREIGRAVLARAGGSSAPPAGAAGAAGGDIRATGQVAGGRSSSGSTPTRSSAGGSHAANEPLYQRNVIDNLTKSTPK